MLREKEPVGDRVGCLAVLRPYDSQAILDRSLGFFLLVLHLDDIIASIRYCSLYDSLILDAILTDLVEVDWNVQPSGLHGTTEK